MKISVCGKGGCGKSTLVTLLAKELAAMGKRVLVIDTDESNYGLHKQLGVELPEDFTAYFGGKQKVLGDMMMSNFTHQFFATTWGIDDIPASCSVEKDNIILMSSGKIHEANEGCACPMGTLMTQFIDHLTLGPDEYALIDMEAGIEHFGRGTNNGTDLVLMVVDPSFESLRLTGKIKELSESIDRPIRFVLNKVTPEIRQLMRNQVCDDTAIIAELPADGDLMTAGLIGAELDGGDGALKEAIRQLAVSLEASRDQFKDSFIADLA